MSASGFPVPSSGLVTSSGFITLVSDKAPPTYGFQPWIEPSSKELKLSPFVIRLVTTFEVV